MSEWYFSKTDSSKHKDIDKFMSKRDHITVSAILVALYFCHCNNVAVVGRFSFNCNRFVVRAYARICTLTIIETWVWESVKPNKMSENVCVRFCAAIQRFHDAHEFIELISESCKNYSGWNGQRNFTMHPLLVCYNDKCKQFHFQATEIGFQ